MKQKTLSSSIKSSILLPWFRCKSTKCLRRGRREEKEKRVNNSGIWFHSYTDRIGNNIEMDLAYLFVGILYDEYWWPLVLQLSEKCIHRDTMDLRTIQQFPIGLTTTNGEMPDQLVKLTGKRKRIRYIFRYKMPL